MRVQLDDDVDEELVGWFRDHPELFNKKFKAYKFTEKKQALKTSKAKELNILYTVMASFIKFASYNLYGLNQGKALLYGLCSSFDIIAVQEHWVLESELYKISDFHNDFYGIAYSAMKR